MKHKTYTLLLIFFIFLAGCSDKNTSEKETINITDMTGRQVEIPKNIETVVCLEAGALRLVTYLNSTNMVVGIEDFEKRDKNRPYIFAHPELTKLPVIGPIHGGDAELISNLHPDVIFWMYANSVDAENLQKKTGIPVIAFDYGDLGNNRDVFYNSLKLMGKILNKEKRSQEIIEYIDENIYDLKKRTKNLSDNQKQKVYVGGVGYYGAQGILSTEPKYLPFSLINANNVASDIENEHVFVDKEILINWNPDIIFIDEVGYKLTKHDLKNVEYKSINAIKNKQIYSLLPNNYYGANYETILANAYYIGKILYPDNFADIDPEIKADEIYTMFLGKPVYLDMKKKFGGFRQIDLDNGDKIG